MKRLILTLFLVLSTLSFAGWEIENFEDEFGEVVEDTYAVTNSIDKQSNFCISKHESSYLASFIFEGVNLGKQGEELEVRCEIDNLSPVSVLGFVWEEDQILDFEVDSDFINKLKKGKMIKVIVKKSDGQEILSKYDLNGFRKTFNKLK